MMDFTLCTPTRFIFKRGAADCTGQTLAAAGFKKLLLVYGQGSVVRSGLLGRVKASLQDAGVEFFDLAGVRPNPEVSSVRAGIEFARAKEVDAVLAIGGGSAIDCAKAIATGVPYEGDVWDFFAKKTPVSAVKPLPIAAVLTIPAAGSEASDSCVISNDELGLKSGMNSDAIRPAFAFMDPELTFSLPAYQTAAGATDMIAHICERWFSGVGAVPVTDNIAAGIIRAVMDAALILKNEPQDYDARATLMWASTLAHDGLCGAGRNLVYGGRAGGWESHALEHELSAFDTSITHGAGLAVVMPAWMRYVWREDPQRFLDFGRLVFGIEPVTQEEHISSIAAFAAPLDPNRPVEDAVTATIDALQDFFKEIGMPSTLGELGIREEDVDKLLPTLQQNKGEVFGAFKKLTMEDARKIYLSAL
ncbi:MAG: iron-containing alcohol dehydrogenase [Coriobacteriales bacterium]